MLGGGFPGVLPGCLGRLCGGRGGPGCLARGRSFGFGRGLVDEVGGEGGDEDEAGDVDEDEDEEEVVVLGDAGCAVMRAVAGLWAAASAAATAGRNEGMSSGCRLGSGCWGGPAVTWQPGGPIWSAAVGEGGAGLRSSPFGLGWAGVLQCAGLCGLASAGGKQFVWAAFGCRGVVPVFSEVCAGGVCGPLGGVGVPWGVGLSAVGVCVLLCLGGGEGCLAGWSVAGVCCCLGGGMRAFVGVCGMPGRRRGGRAMGGDCAGVCVVSVYVSACSGALVWSDVGRAVWRRSLPSPAAAARISQTSMRMWCTSWSVVGRGYASSGLRPTRRRILWMVWYPQVRE